MRVKLTIAMLLAGLLIVPPLLGRAQQSGAQWPSRSKRFALLVGVNAYDDPQITPLVGPSNDMHALEDALVAHAGFDRDRIIRLSTDQTDAQMRPTYGNILLKLSNVLKALPSDGLLLMAFSGHGAERDGRAFLLPADAKVNYDIELLERTALEVGSLKRMIENKRDNTGRKTGVAQVVVLLDACRNDPTSGKDLTINPLTKAYDFDLRNSNVKAFVMLYATSIGYRAYENRLTKQGYFIGEIVNGLNGSAVNGRGEVMLEDLIRYVEDKVPTKVALALGQDQKPFAVVEGYKASDLVIAVNLVPRPTPTPISIPTPAPRMSVAGVPLVAMSFPTANTNAAGKAINQRTEQCWGYVEDLGNGVKLEMVEIPAGDFLMGSPNSESGRGSDEGPQHQVRLNGFLMGRYELTQRQWKAVMGGLPPKMSDLRADLKGDDLPVVRVSWDEVQEFIKKLNEQLRLSGSRYQLPSEAEWEYAARGGMKTAFAFGETISPDVVNYAGEYSNGNAEKGLFRKHQIKVGNFVANAWGLFDMHGNVWEWCEDDGHDNYRGAPVYGQPWIDRPSRGFSRVVRGCSWYNDAVYCRSAKRYNYSPDDCDDNLGFRLLRTLR